MSSLTPLANRSEAFHPPSVSSGPAPHSGWEIFKKRAYEITQVALKGLVPLIAGLICIALFPPVVNAVLLPIVVIGLTFLMAFYGVMNVKPAQKDLNIFPVDDSFFPLPKIEWDYSSLSPVPPADAPPRGIVRPMASNNCWLNMLIQMVRRDPVVSEWLRNPTEERPLGDLCALGLFMRQYDKAIFSNQDRLVDHHVPLVRRALAKLSGREISPHFARQEDIASGLDVLMGHDHLPDARKTNLIEQHFYREGSDGYPPLLNKEPRVQQTFNWGRIELPLAVSDERQSIRDLLPSFFQDVNRGANSEEESNRYSELEADDGGTYVYVEDRCLRFFERPPEKLWIQVKRFTYDRATNQGHKNSSPIDADEEIQIPTADGPRAYRLDSFAIHEGKSLSSGHYYGYVGNYYCNDGLVTQPSLEQRQQDSQQAYLLLYSLQ